MNALSVKYARTIRFFVDLTPRSDGGSRVRSMRRSTMSGPNDKCVFVHGCETLSARDLEQACIQQLADDLDLVITDARHSRKNPRIAHPHRTAVNKYRDFLASINTSVAGTDEYGDLSWHIACSADANANCSMVEMGDECPEDIVEYLETWAKIALTTAAMCLDDWKSMYPQLVVSLDERLDKLLSRCICIFYRIDHARPTTPDNEVQGCNMNGGLWSAANYATAVYPIGRPIIEG